MGFPASDNPLYLGIYVDSLLTGNGTFKSILGDFSTNGKVETLLRRFQSHGFNRLVLYDQDSLIGTQINPGVGVLTVGQGYYVISAPITHNAIVHPVGSTFIAVNGNFTTGTTGKVRLLGAVESLDDEVFSSLYKAKLAQFITLAKTHYGYQQVSLVISMQHVNATRYDGTIMARCVEDYNATRTNPIEKAEYAIQWNEWWLWNNADINTVRLGDLSYSAAGRQLSVFPAIFNSGDVGKFVKHGSEIRQIVEYNNPALVFVDRPWPTNQIGIPAGSWFTGVSANFGSLPYDMVAFRAKLVKDFFYLSQRTKFESRNSSITANTQLKAIAHHYDRMMHCNFNPVPNYPDLLPRLRGNPTGTPALADYRSGTISTVGTAVTGVGTNFLTEFRIGSQVMATAPALGQSQRVIAIADNTHMTIGGAFFPDLPIGTQYGLFTEIGFECSGEYGSPHNNSGYWLRRLDPILGTPGGFSLKRPADAWKLIIRNGYVSNPAQITPAYNNETSEADLKLNFYPSAIDWFDQSIIEGYIGDLRDPITFTIATVNASCSNDDGTVAFNSISGGTGPYTFAIIPGFDALLLGTSTIASGVYSGTITGIPSGNYTAWLQDSLGDKVWFNFTVGFDGPTIDSIVVTAPTCAGLTNGTITINATPGLFALDPAVPYSLEGPDPDITTISQLSNVFTNLVPGTYHVTVADESGCYVQQTVVVPDNNYEILFDNLSHEPTCADPTSGYVHVIDVTGYDPTHTPLEYSNDGGATWQLSPDFDNLPAGTYHMRVKDSSGCISDIMDVILSPGVADFSAHVTGNDTDVYCMGDDPDNLQLNAEFDVMGAGPYNFQWSVDPPGPTTRYDLVGETSDQLIVSPFPPGTYTYYCIITDTNTGCTIEISKTITTSINNTPDPIVVMTGELTACSCDQPVRLIVTNPTDFISVHWHGVNFTLEHDGFYVDILDDCSLDEWIIDVIGTGDPCVTTKRYTFTRLPAIQVGAIVHHVLCNGSSNGSIALNISGGDGNYLVHWTGPFGFTSTQQTINGLGPGTYQAVVQDGTGCSVTISRTINQTNPVLSGFVLNQPACSGVAANAHVLPSGGIGPYSILWDDLTTSTNHNNLSAGMHWVKITDSNGCFIQVDFEVVPSGGLTVSLQAFLPQCPDKNNGVLISSVVNGTGMFDYLWMPNGETTSVITGLTPGTYGLTVTDRIGGCTGTASIDIADVTCDEPTDDDNRDTAIGNAMCCAGQLGAKAAMYEKSGDKDAACLLKRAILVSNLIWAYDQFASDGPDADEHACLDSDEQAQLWALIKHYCPDCGC